MKEYSSGKQAWYTILAMTVSYGLLAFQSYDGLSLLSKIEYIDSFILHMVLCAIDIMFPIIFVKARTNFKVWLMIFDPVIIYVLAMLYCPYGWYFIVIKSDFFRQKNTDDQWTTNIIVIMVVIMHFIAFGIGKLIYLRKAKKALTKNTDIQA